MGNVLRDALSGDAPRRTRIPVVCFCVMLAFSRVSLTRKIPAARIAAFQASLGVRYPMYHNVRIEVVDVEDREKYGWVLVSHAYHH